MNNPSAEYRRAISPSTLAALILLVLARACQASPVPPPRADDSTLCSFITHEMQSDLPQVPTLCSPVTANGPLAGPRTLAVSIFSPTNVLGGNMRRAWSTALFQSFQALFFGGALNDACARIPPEVAHTPCEFRISDTSLSNIYYQLDSSQAVMFGESYKALQGDPASDDAYLAWWQSLEAGKTERHPEYLSKGNAQWIAQDACKQFAHWIRGLDEAFPKAQLSVPGCTVMLATNKSVYVVLDFPNFFDALVGNYRFELPDTFGKAFDGTAYQGQVVFRSPWNETGNRTYNMYDLGGLELAWEENHAAGKDTALAMKLVFEAEENGVEGRKALTSGKHGTLRMSDVVRVAQVHGSGVVMADLSDGSEWSFPARFVPGCQLAVGTTVFEHAADPNSKSRSSATLDCHSWKSYQGTFTGGW
jgi:hypothetical protein